MVNYLPVKPSVKIKLKTLRFAIYARVVSFVGAAFLSSVGLGLVIDSFVPGIRAILVGVLVMLLELEIPEINRLREPQIRGVIYIAAGIISSTNPLTAFLGLVIITGGVLYLVYNYQ